MTAFTRARLTRRGFGAVVLASLLAACGQATATAPAGSGTRPSEAPKAGSAPTSSAAPSPITVYSGRAENLVAPVLDQFTKATGIEVKARFGDTAELAATILEEKGNSPADVYFAQDAGALGALAAEDRLSQLDPNILGRVDQRFRSSKSLWVGVSGRARVIAYDTTTLAESDMPDSVAGLADARWRGRVGWSPKNGSFQAFVTAKRMIEGDESTRGWLLAMKANGAKDFANNTAQLQGIADGQISVALPNHYYVYSFYKEKGESFPVRNYHPRGGGADAMVNVAGVGILTTSRSRDAASRLVEYLLSADAQRYFADATYEYPLIAGVQAAPRLKPLDQIKTPAIDLSNLTDLRGTLKLLQETGVV
ncbi:MAG: iron ABC transporter substrate-binding protein [Chloroflexota bacterium]|nr:MAG: iron ABC transporter substrate-binding protein [Chloroflexota bacterium]